MFVTNGPLGVAQLTMTMEMKSHRTRSLGFKSCAIQPWSKWEIGNDEDVVLPNFKKINNNVYLKMKYSFVGT